MKWYRHAADDDHDEWFGESVVRDAEGNPMVVYHGSDSPDRFSTFDSPSGPRARLTSGYGNWFTTSEEEAISYSNRQGGTGQVYRTHLSIQNPLDLRDPRKHKLADSISREARRKALEEVEHNEEDLGLKEITVSFNSRETMNEFHKLEAQYYKQGLMDIGFDGIIMPDEHGTPGAETYVTLHPSQIRMAP